MTCSPQDLMAVAQCFECLTDRQLRLAGVVLLCRILLDRNPMATCNPQSLLNDASCFDCLSDHQLNVIQTQLYCEILGAGGGSGCIVCGDVNPVGAPQCSCALAYNRTNSSFWYWDATLGVWGQLIGG